jgi:hypothetical protein
LSVVFTAPGETPGAVIFSIQQVTKVMCFRLNFIRDQNWHLAFVTFRTIILTEVKQGESLEKNTSEERYPSGGRRAYAPLGKEVSAGIFSYVTNQPCRIRARRATDTIF